MTFLASEVMDWTLLYLVVLLLHYECVKKLNDDGAPVERMGCQGSGPTGKGSNLGSCQSEGFKRGDKRQSRDKESLDEIEATALVETPEAMEAAVEWQELHNEMLIVNNMGSLRDQYCNQHLLFQYPTGE
jgi:hypothetical protein